MITDTRFSQPWHSFAAKYEPSPIRLQVCQDLQSEKEWGSGPLDLQIVPMY